MAKYVNLGGQWYSKKAVKEIKKNGPRAKVGNCLFNSYQTCVLKACVCAIGEKDG